jgi:hypothetical protein
MKKEISVEWAPFELAENVSVEDFLKASDVMQKEFLIKQEGYLKRELLKISDKKWVDLVYL